VPKKKINTSRRIHSYDFFQGVLATGLIFVMTFLEFSISGIEIFYRWASLGFLFFSGILIGEVFLKNKNTLFFIKRGIQLFSIFIFLNIVSFLSQFSLEAWQNFSLLMIRGDYTLVAHLLLSMSALFFITPIFKYIPNFLGFFWALLGFFLLDVLALEKGIFYVNIFFLMAGIMGIFTGKFFSLEKIRMFFHTKFLLLPYIFLYIALAILAFGGYFSGDFISYFQFFWSFHFLIMILLYFSLPSLLFSGVQKKPALRKFFETLGVESLFIYVFSSLILESIHFIFPKFEGFNPFILAIHITILSFGVVVILRKTFQKSKKFKKYFRFLF